MADPFALIFKESFAAAFEAADRFAGRPVLRAEDAAVEPASPDARLPKEEQP